MYGNEKEAERATSEQDKTQRSFVQIDKKGNSLIKFPYFFPPPPWQ